jgi:hypothetical protein
MDRAAVPALAEEWEPAAEQAAAADPAREVRAVAVELAWAAPAVEAEAVQAAVAVSAAELAVAQKLLLESGSPHRRSSEGPL